MLQFADIIAAVLAAIATVTPENGATVSLDAPGGASQRPVRLAWSGGGEGEVLLAVKPDGGAREVFALTNATEAYITNLELGRRYLWGVVATDGGGSAASDFTTEANPPRLLRVDGLSSMRDLGGWTGLGGLPVRQNMLFRSSGLRASSVRKGGPSFTASYGSGEQNVTDAGLAYMKKEFGVKTDIELRPSGETAFMQSSLLGPDVAWYKIPFPSGAAIDDIVRGREPFMRIFRLLADGGRYPVLFHCADGCERSGTLELVLLGLLGVSEEDLRFGWAAGFPAGAGAERLDALLGYLHSLGGSDIAKCCEAYASSCGVSDEEIAAFRRIMLEGGAE